MVNATVAPGRKAGTLPLLAVLAVLACALGYGSAFPTDFESPFQWCESTHKPRPFNGPVPPVPSLPEQYSLKVECNILEKDWTVELEEHFDQPNRRASMARTFNGTTTRTIYNFEAGEKYDIYADDTCTTRPGQPNFFSYFTMDKNDRPSITTVNQMLRFGSMMNMSYVGTTAVRGIKVNHWTSCQEWSQVGAKFQLDWYFTHEHYLGAIGDVNREMPIRIVLNGTAGKLGKHMGSGNDGYNFFHFYDFTSIRVGLPRDLTVFEIPPGVVCMGRSDHKVMPLMPDVFQMNMEITMPNNPMPPQQQEMLYDYQHLLVETREKKMMPRGLGTKPRTEIDWEDMAEIMYNVIEDYNTGLKYTVNQNDFKCSVEAMAPSGGTAPVMAHGQSLLQIVGTQKADTRDFVYQGVTTLRHMKVEVWGRVDNGMTQQVFFQADRMASRKAYGKGDVWKGTGQGQGQGGGWYPNATGGGNYPSGSGGRPQGSGGSYPQGSGGRPQGSGGNYPQGSGGNYPQGSGGRPQGSGWSQNNNGGGRPQGSGGSYPQGSGGRPQGSGWSQNSTGGGKPQGSGGNYPQGSGGRPQGSGWSQNNNGGGRPQGSGGSYPQGPGGIPQGSGGRPQDSSSSGNSWDDKDDMSVGPGSLPRRKSKMVGFFFRNKTAVDQRNMSSFFKQIMNEQMMNWLNTGKEMAHAIHGDFDDSPDISDQVAWGMNMRNAMGNHHGEALVNVFDFKSKHTQMDHFQVYSCYKAEQTSQILLLVKTPFQKNVLNQMTTFLNSLRRALAEAVRGSILSISNMAAMPMKSKASGFDATTVTFTLLGHTPIQGSGVRSVSIEDSKVALRKAIGNGIAFKVADLTHTVDKKLYMLDYNEAGFKTMAGLDSDSHSGAAAGEDAAHSQGSADRLESGGDSNTSIRVEKSDESGFSSGAVAGIAVATMALGGLIAIAVATVLYKRRRTEVPMVTFKSEDA